MQAVILAGGLGTRLRPVTTELPKVLVPVAGRPFIDWLIDALPRDTFDEVLMLTGYLGDQVESHCGDGSQYGLPVTYSREPEPLGTAGAMAFAAAKLQEQFVVLNGDTYIEPDYARLLAAHKRLGAMATMVVATPPRDDIRPNVQLGQDGMVVRYAKGIDDPSLTLVDAGVLLAARDVLSLIPATRPSGLEVDVFPRLADERRLAAVVVDRPYLDVGTPQGLAAMQAQPAVCRTQYTSEHHDE